jgi:hypothetical protein
VPTTRRVEVKAEGKQITAGEVRKFAFELDVAEVPDDAPVGHEVSWGGKLRILHADNSPAILGGR